MPQNAMSHFASEIEESKLVKHFLNELDLGICTANQEIIHARIPDLDRKKAFVFATLVARLRADYLDAAFKLCSAGTHPDPQDIADLRAKRETYEEAREAFNALYHAIERGYIDVAKMNKG
ncbi:hypothetical protein [Pelagibius marinus]|uniref:hypothetical protein n=1 Tax=Pelagibius marinus TaxID=2762760 RepID=UPI001D039B40|nr:hypothetical protein [Pelagibius marinus]